MELSALFGLLTLHSCRHAHLTGTAGTGLAPGVGEAGGPVWKATQAFSGTTEGAVLVAVAVGVADALHTFAVDSAPPAAGATIVVVASTPPVGPGPAPFSIFKDRFNMNLLYFSTTYNSCVILTFCGVDFIVVASVIRDFAPGLLCSWFFGTWCHGSWFHGH